MLAPQAAPLIAWPKHVAAAPQPAANAAPETEAPVLPEQAQLEAAIEPAPEVAPPAAVPYAAAPQESSEETPQAAAATTPAAVEAITEVAEAMTGANKTPDVVMAASALPTEEPAVPEITVVRKTEATQPASKPAAAPAAKKAAPARSATHRGRKG
jgi:hypothetical protein